MKKYGFVLNDAIMGNMQARTPLAAMRKFVASLTAEEFLSGSDGDNGSMTDGAVFQIRMQVLRRNESAPSEAR